MIVVMIEAGTTMPPIPRPAKTNKPQRVCRLSTSATANDPQPECSQLDILFQGLSMVQCAPQDMGRLRPKALGIDEAYQQSSKRRTQS